MRWLDITLVLVGCFAFLYMLAFVLVRVERARLVKRFHHARVRSAEPSEP